MERGGIFSTGADAGRLSIGENDIRSVFQRRRHQPSRLIDVRGDGDGNPDLLIPGELREAAVLVPLVDRPEGFTILFTQRTAHLASHAGQISFPGGGVEPEDEDPQATALRETEEEVGLPRHHIELLGNLDTYITRTGYRVVPVVGLVRPPFILNPDPYEVDTVFEVPLSFILNPANRKREGREFKGAIRHFWAFPYGDRYIWGATAGMLVNLCEVLAEVMEG
ncbi:CoA pyrophosphatase [Niveispirillum sp. SYP-B3756]|uniref:CoA pyrophosphatase n=1 Tax=Niveispirillum sp. SYP-B3756 TaxID=2662178 RepID=UPI0012921314|nr:CoA pyrophosphatase [Niveispirillum sp. SYP-B3756]MQP67969.1 CoA pyrophosphatase [Niveispirillum sp. SYP-B3756]